MAPHSSTLAWRIPWMEEPGRLWSMGSLRVRHDWATSLSLFTFMPWRRKWQHTSVFCLENPRDGGAWWAAVYGVTQSQIRLKWLNSSNTHSPNTSKWSSKFSVMRIQSLVFTIDSTVLNWSLGYIWVHIFINSITVNLISNQQYFIGVLV